MALPLGEAVSDQFWRTLEIDDPDIVPSMYEDVPIGALQRGAGDHRMLAGLADPVDLAGNCLQPGPTVFIGQGVAGAHLGDVARGMKLVAILVRPAEPFGELVRDGALARAGHAHHDQRAGAFACLIAHGNSPAAQPHPPAKSSRRWIAHGWRAGSRHPARASRSHAYPGQTPRTASRGRSRAPARSASPAARTARHVLGGRRPPSARFPRWPGKPETTMRYGLRARTP